MSTVKEKLKTKKEKSRAGWNPDEGDVLEGTIMEIGETETKKGPAKYAYIQTENSETIMVYLNSVLQSQFEEEEIGEGDTIGIEYLGKVTSKKSDQEYKNFCVVKAD